VESLRALVQRAIEEDVGAGDVTTRAIVDEGVRARALITQKQAGVIFGLDAAATAFELLDDGARVQRLAKEGAWGEKDAHVMAVKGRARALLSAERTALNFIGHLSGVATLAARAAQELEGTGAQVLDTRKTTPGLRELEKAAVRAGGAANHRAGLYDAILIKENHIAAAGGVARAIEAARASVPELATMLQIEVRNPREIEEALAAGAPRLLLDNMDRAQLRDAVRQVDGRAQLEASGGVEFEALGSIAATGVEWISMGALTHSAPALDVSMALELLS
jgi:nicotinate-nucleotide pyrophosphorylase (carboxylating)